MQTDVPGTFIDGSKGSVGVLAWIPNGCYVSDQSGIGIPGKLAVLACFGFLAVKRGNNCVTGTSMGVNIGTVGVLVLIPNGPYISA